MNDVRAALTAAADSIAAARRVFAGGGTVDLAPLCKTVAEICSGIGLLDPAARPPLAVELAALDQALDRLGEEVREQHRRAGAKG